MFFAGTGVISVQVLSKFWVAVTRKIRTPLSIATARREAELFSLMTVVDLDAGLFYDALRQQQLYQISYWEAQVVAAAVNRYTTITTSEYRAITSSWVTNRSGSVCAWAMRIRSKGSR